MADIDVSELDLACSAARAARPAFAEMGWTWRDEGVPDTARLQLRIREMLSACELGHSLSSGRLTVSRWLEDEREHTEVTLQLGTAEREAVRGCLP